MAPNDEPTAVPTAPEASSTFVILLDPPNKVILSGEIKEYNATDGPTVFLEQKSTGELNVYKGDSATEEFLIWTNGFTGDFGEYYTRMGPEGELATIEGNLENKGKKKWIAGDIVGDLDNAYYFVLNPDESVSVIHNKPTGTDADEIIWTSKKPTILLGPPNKFILSGEIKEYNATDGQSVFLEQMDTGELKVYKGDSATDEFLVWTNGFTDGEFGEYYTRMGPSGELATQEGNLENKGKKVWFAGEIGVEDNAYYFVLSPDGDSVSIIHNTPTGTDADEIIWTSKKPTILLDPPNKVILSGVINEYTTTEGELVFLEQMDTGELNVYKGDDATEENLVWTNGFSDGDYGEYYTRMGPEGELATIEGNPEDRGKVAWLASDEIGDLDNAYYFVLNPDGESVSVVHNTPTGTDDDDIIWTSKLSSTPSEAPQPIMEPTGEVPTMSPEIEPTEEPVNQPVVLLDPPNKIIESGEIKEYNTTEGIVSLEQKSTGELNVYRGAVSENLVWSNGFSGDYGEYFTRLAPNGNLVTQEGNSVDKGKKKWFSDSIGEEDNRYYFVLDQADTVSIVHGLGDDDEEVIWTSQMTMSPTVVPVTPTPVTPGTPTPAPTTGGAPTSSACFANARGVLSFAVSMIVFTVGTWVV